MIAIAKTPRELNACTTSDAVQSPHQCNRVIPFYPLRYAIAPAVDGGYAYEHENLERGFPLLACSQYVLRSLRDDDGYLYILDPDNREQILCFVYRSPDGETNGGSRRPACFQRVQLDEKFRVTGLVGELLPFPYIPASDHKPQTVTIWFADTLLSPRKLTALHQNPADTLGAFGTSINLTPWLAAFAAGPNPERAPKVPHTLRMEDIAGQQAIGLGGATVSWSEYAHAAHLPTDADMAMAQGPDGARLAVVLHDPVGMASELNHRIDGVLRQWSTYNEHAARLRWVSDAIDALGNNVARETELQALSNDAIGSALPPGVTGGAANTARAYAHEKGLAAKRALFMDSVDEKARTEFLRNDGPTVKHYQRQLDAAAADLLPWGVSYTGPGNVTAAIRELYDWEDAGNFVAGRGAVVRTLYGLICCEPGTQALAHQLTPDGPREGTLLAYALAGHPKISAWAATRRVFEATTDQLATQALNDLGVLIKEIVPDSASRQITSLAMLALMNGQTPMSGKAIWSSRYAALFEAAEGRLAIPEQVATRDVPELLRREANLNGPVKFRLSPLAQGTKDYVTIVRLTTAIDAAEVAENGGLAAGLRSRLSLWHGTKVGLGGLNALTSVTNTATALSQLTAADQSALVHSLNVTGSLLGIGWAAKGLTAAVLLRQRDILALSGKAADAEAINNLAHRADRSALALAAAAAAVIALKDILAHSQQGRSEKKVTAAGIAIQGAAAAIGFSYLHAKVWTTAPTTPSVSVAAHSASRRVVASAMGRAAIWFAAPPMGLIITTLQLAYTWNQSRLDKAKTADWIAQGCLGISPTFTGSAEQKAYYELFLKPKIDTSYRFGNIVREHVTPRVGLPRALRDVCVLLPGWQPQISAYTLTQHVFFGVMTEGVFSDATKVEHRNGEGYLRLEAHNLAGNTVVRYWPNGFTQPELVLEMTH